jgi:hypothetical protein
MSTNEAYHLENTIRFIATHTSLRYIEATIRFIVTHSSLRHLEVNIRFIVTHTYEYNEAYGGPEMS